MTSSYLLFNITMYQNLTHNQVIDSNLLIKVINVWKNMYERRKKQSKKNKKNHFIEFVVCGRCQFIIA